MAKERVEVSGELAARIMFLSDRTCCVCRLEKHKTQIHHIDKDPSNSALENLAVICLNCHSDAHTTAAFVRNLTPELIRLYNSSWRDIVRLKLNPPSESAANLELSAEAYLEASLDAHRWKVRFMSLAGSRLPEGDPEQFQDVWDLMAELWIPKYSKEVYEHFRPLFAEAIGDVRARFDRLIQLFPNALSLAFQSMLIRANRQLEVEQSAYSQLPAILAEFVPADQHNLFFRTRFAEVVCVLRDISREADRRRSALTSPEI